MRRYTISKSFKNSILDTNETIRDLNSKFGFDIRNVLYKSLTINELQRQKIENFLNIHFNLERAYLNYGKNLGLPKTKIIPKVNYNADLAEFIGIMLGDGNIWNNRVRIAFDKRNKIYIEHVFKLFRKIFEINFKREVNNNTNQFYLYYNNLFVVEALLNFGLFRGDKIKNQAGIPDWIKRKEIYVRKCLRGLIDTDGCIYFSKRDKRIYIKFTNFNKQLLGDFKNLTEILGYNFAKANKNNWCLYRKDEVIKFINEIKPLKSNGVVV